MTIESTKDPKAVGTMPVAIIGMACIFPKAPDVRTFWTNILAGVDAIGEPLDAWGAERYLGDGRIKTAKGGYLRDLYRFDPTEFGIMPNSINGSEPDQFLALRVARDALADAGYAGPDADHTATGIILGHSTYLHRGQGTLIQQNIVLDQTLELLQLAMPHLDEADLDGLRAILRKRLPPSNADTVPGLVPNVMTGRIANRLNLHGPNYILDAACSSSLLAVGAAIDELHTGRSRMMLAGGVNATLPAEVSTIFTQLGALTTRGKVRPFSVGSDGTLLGEGLGVVVLKRLSDALADNDRIYAVLRGVAQSSDGRGNGLLAPSHEGETLAIHRAYEVSDTDPATIGLFEAHGTGIPLGDQTEIASLQAVFGERTTPQGVIALGSVKSMISHCIPAAGIAGMIKMALSLHHKVLPPMLCDEVNPALGIDKTPFYINTQVAPWISRLDRPRRAAVNAFGFGGTNAHAILEEAPAGASVPRTLTARPVELCVISAQSADALAARLETLATAVEQNTAWGIAEVAAALVRADTGGQHRIAVVAKDTAALVKSMRQSATRLRDPANPRWPTRGGVAYAAQRAKGKVAFLYPGEGSQYQGMFADLALAFGEIREWLDFWHGLHDLPRGSTRTDVAFPTCETNPERRAQLDLEMHGMDVGSEAVYIGDLAMHALLTALEVKPDVMLGHSSGESAALSAAGANPAVGYAQQAACIRKHHEVYKELLEQGKIPTGALLAVGAIDRKIVESTIAAVEGVVVAMDNCANQMVLFGPPASIERVQNELGKLGGVCMPLPFDRGYHTAAFSDASAAFLQYYKEIKIGAPKVPLYSCSSVGLFSDKAADARKLAAAQWATPVRFRETILKMHEDGVETFIEVGPSSNLSAFVSDILKGRPHLALATNVRRRNDVEQLFTVLGQLYVGGHGPNLAKLFASRALPTIDLNAVPKRSREVFVDNTMPMIRLAPADREAIIAITANAATLRSIAAPAPAATETDTDVQGEAVAVALPLAVAVPTPLLDIVEYDASHLLARCHASLAHDNFVRDHVMTGPVSESDPELVGLSCVPLAVSLEAMAEACAVLAGRTDLCVIENIRAFDWIALDEGETTLDVRAETVDAASGRYKASIGTARGPSLSAEFEFAPRWQLGPVPELVERRPSEWNAPNLYNTGMFHGPVFRSLQYIDAWDDTGVDVQLSDGDLAGFQTAGHTPAFILNPMLLDALGQVVACWLAQFFGTEFNNFPSTMARIELYDPAPGPREGIMMRARQTLVEGQSTDPGAPRTWNFECVDGSGQVLFRGSGLLNVFWHMPSAYHAVRWRPLLGWLGHATAANDDGLPGWQVPALPVDFLIQSGSICLRTLAHVFLDAGERRQWQALQAPPRARIDWLFDRAAVKELVRHWIHEQTGQLLYATDVQVQFTAEGEPVVSGWWTHSLVAAPQISFERVSNAYRASIASVSADLQEGTESPVHPGVSNPSFPRSRLSE